MHIGLQNYKTARVGKGERWGEWTGFFSPAIKRMETICRVHLGQYVGTLVVGKRQVVNWAATHPMYPFINHRNPWFLNSIIGHWSRQSASTMFGTLGAKLWKTLLKGVKEAGSVDELNFLLGGHLSGIADRPPTRGYSCFHGNSLLDYAVSRGRISNV